MLECSFIVHFELKLTILMTMKIFFQINCVLYLCGGHRGMTLTAWKEGSIDAYPYLYCHLPRTN